ncbi:hypothetical protein [Paraburkholderia phenoliruptrix]|uniref:Uncharacterized protein n=1 Tax=Paraburkholderia phenoliruptrix BR3459a TaxID=1229205 RepID=K0DZI7_9BURK|nr:hypothetical protein [Paraburkholderia phenoliruptrix]AFT90062.1 hypothetical protein BUPH_08237 [Paraburkholderia phenoliruptrix BR3459a]
MYFVHHGVAIQPSVFRAGNTFVAKVSILEEDRATTSLGDSGHFANREPAFAFAVRCRTALRKSFGRPSPWRAHLDFGANFRLERSRLHEPLRAVPNKYRRKIKDLLSGLKPVVFGPRRRQAARKRRPAPEKSVRWNGRTSPSSSRQLHHVAGA